MSWALFDDELREGDDFADDNDGESDQARCRALRLADSMERTLPLAEDMYWQPVSMMKDPRRAQGRTDRHWCVERLQTWAYVHFAWTSVLGWAPKRQR